MNKDNKSTQNKKWEEATKLFREAAKKVGFTQEDLNRIIEDD